MSKKSAQVVRDIRRHPLEEFRKQLKAGQISRLPQLSSEFKVALPLAKNFVVRFRGRGARPISIFFLRGVNGGMTAFAHKSFEIELLGKNNARTPPSSAAEKRVTSKAK